jgi:hypothetical protein
MLKGMENENNFMSQEDDNTEQITNNDSVGDEEMDLSNNKPRSKGKAILGIVVLIIIIALGYMVFAGRGEESDSTPVDGATTTAENGAY